MDGDHTGVYFGLVVVRVLVRACMNSKTFFCHHVVGGVCVMVTLFVCYVFLFLFLSLRRFELFFALRFGIETVVVEVLVHVVCFISIKIIESIFVL